VFNSFSVAIGCRHPRDQNEGIPERILFSDFLCFIYLGLDPSVVRESQISRDAGTALDQGKFRGARPPPMQIHGLPDKKAGGEMRVFDRFETPAACRRA
jgi:hypothetical protein